MLNLSPWRCGNFTEHRPFIDRHRLQHWFLATKSLSQIFISKILIFEIVYENWRVLAVNHEINATLWPFCTLKSVLHNVKISGTFIERPLVVTLPDVVMSMGMY